ncbi:MAG: hypothetical protein IPM34_01540 [Saprospiraceae bacterium]|nr:hypothetical protein [Saprospiraceae bacterium]
MKPLEEIEIQKPVLHPGDLVSKARLLFKEGQCMELPVVDNGKCLGTFHELVLHNYEEDVILNPMDFKNASIASAGDEIPVLWRKFMENQCSTLIYQDAEGKFLGYITVWDVVKIYKQVLGIGESNCLLVLKLRKMDYRLSKLATMAEEAECYIIHSFIVQASDREVIYLNLDLEGANPEGFIQTLERHEIEVERFLCRTEKEDVLQERYDMLMSYLNV